MKYEDYLQTLPQSATNYATKLCYKTLPQTLQQRQKELTHKVHFLLIQIFLAISKLKAFKLNFTNYKLYIANREMLCNAFNFLRVPLGSLCQNIVTINQNRAAKKRATKQRYGTGVCVWRRYFSNFQLRLDSMKLPG